MFLIYELLIEKLKCVHLRRTERSVVAARYERRALGSVAARSDLYLLFPLKHQLTQMGRGVDLSVAQKRKM